MHAATAILAAASVGFLCAAPGLAEPRARSAPDSLVRRAPWQSPESWRRLRLGMSQADVLRILGEPGKVTRYYAFERWEYPDALGQRVNFDERGRLSVWGALAR
jgi:outer membrane protein assembly factor BamE (lipoprotein component of BamABCDE complex)